MLGTVLVLLAVLLSPPAGRAAEPAAPLSPAEASQALEVLGNPALRSQVMTTLEAIARVHPQAARPPSKAAAAAPAVPAATSPAAAAKPAAAAAAKPTAPAPAKVQLNPNGLGAAVIFGAPGLVAFVWDRAVRATHGVHDLPILWAWLVVMVRNPLAHAILSRAIWRVVIAFAAGLATETALRWLLRSSVATLAASAPAQGGEAEIVSEPPPEPEESSEPETPDEMPNTEHRHRIGAGLLLRRLPLVLGRLVLDLLPVLGFAVAAHIVAATNVGGSEQDRLIVLAMADAYVVSAAIIVFARMLFQPDRPRMRLLRISDANAAWATVWIRRLTIVTVFGFAIAEVGLALGMAREAYVGLLKVDGLISHVFLAVMVLQKQRAVRKRISAPAGATGPVVRLRNAFAPIWHWIALLFIVGTWITWAFEVSDGYVKVLHFILILVAVLLLTRLASIVLLGALERVGRISPEVAELHPDWQERLRLYQPLVQSTSRFIIYGGAFVLLLELSGVPIFAWFGRTALGHNLAAGFATILVTFIISIVIWEAVNAGFRAHLSRLTRTQHAARAARLKTLLPLLRTALLVTILIIAGLTVLSEIGIDIGPLLAGAGIVGVAIGFGSQKLVQDLITGIFLLLENAMQVGDWVTVSNLSGTVEALSVRTIRLRAADGSVHIIPFSSVTSVTNTNRGLGNAAVAVSIAFDADIDRACALLKEIASAMRAEPQFADRMLSDLQLWGVDKVDGASVTITGQIVCTDTGRWPVQREFNRRMKQRFEDEGVPIYNPAQSYLMPVVPGPAGGVRAASPIRARRPAEAGGGE